MKSSDATCCRRCLHLLCHHLAQQMHSPASSLPRLMPASMQLHFLSKCLPVVLMHLYPPAVLTLGPASCSVCQQLSQARLRIRAPTVLLLVPLQQQAPMGAVPGVPPRVASKVFPQLLQKRAPDLFNVFAGSWRVQRAKASTARVVCWQELGLVNRWVPPTSRVRTWFVTEEPAAPHSCRALLQCGSRHCPAGFGLCGCQLSEVLSPHRCTCLTSTSAAPWPLASR